MGERPPGLPLILRVHHGTGSDTLTRLLIGMEFRFPATLASITVVDIGRPSYDPIGWFAFHRMVDHCVEKSRCVARYVMHLDPAEALPEPTSVMEYAHRKRFVTEDRDAYDRLLFDRWADLLDYEDLE